MATSYPGAIDSFTNPTISDELNSSTVPHATQHANINDAIVAIETALGINPKGSYASVAAALAGKVDNTRTVTAGTGLTGGGDLSANRSFSVNYGTAAGTAAQGNDSRIVNAVPNSRTITAGTGLTGGGDLSGNRTLAVDSTVVVISGGKVSLDSSTSLVLNRATDASTASGNSPALITGPPTGTHLRIDGNEIVPMLDDTTPGVLNLAIDAGASVNIGSGVSFKIAALNGGYLTSGTTTDSSGYLYITHGLGAVPSIVVMSMGSSSATYGQYSIQHAAGGDTSTQFRVAVRNTSTGNPVVSSAAPAIEWIAILTG